MAVQSGTTTLLRCSAQGHSVAASCRICVTIFTEGTRPSTHALHQVRLAFMSSACPEAQFSALLKSLYTSGVALNHLQLDITRISRGLLSRLKSKPLSTQKPSQAAWHPKIACICSTGVGAGGEGLTYLQGGLTGWITQAWPLVCLAASSLARCTSSV